MKEMITYLHAACFYPVVSTWKAAIEQGHFKTWPGLTCKNIDKYLEKIEVTTLGHMKQTFQNFQSTKPKEDKKEPNNKQPEKETRTGEMFATIMEPTNKIFTYLLGPFPVRSIKGNMYDYDSNAILIKALKI